MLHTALAGNMCSVKEWAKELAAGDARYNVFAGKLIRLADACQSKAVLAFAREAADATAETHRLSSSVDVQQ